MRKIFAITAILFLFSCNKETTKQPSELLPRSWKITSLKVVTPLQGTPLEGTTTNWYNADECKFKQIWTFRSNATLEIKEAPTCVLAGAQSSAIGTFNLSDNNSKINIRVDWYGGFTFNIINLTKTKLTVQRNEAVGFGGSQIINLLFEYEFTAQ